MRILGICGSPRKGNTEWLIKQLMATIEKHGGETELDILKNINIKIRDGCLLCPKTETCHLKDDMQEIYAKILSADALVMGSPVYMHAPTSHKNSEKRALSVGIEKNEKGIDGYCYFIEHFSMYVTGYN